MSKDETQVSASRVGLRVNWVGVFQLLAWLLPFLTALAMFYLSTVFVKHDELAAAIKPFEPLPERVHELAQFVEHHEKTDEKKELKFDAMQTSIVTLSTQQAETDKKIDRILNHLERLNIR